MANPKFCIIPNKRTVTSRMKESGSYFLCPTNTVMTGRYHTGDENGQTQYEYATLKAVDENGNLVAGIITVEDVKWDTSIKESSGAGYNAPAGRVIVGRQHRGDSHALEYYNIPVSIINSFNTGDIHTNLRPRDDNSIGHDEVFLQPNDHTVGDMNPTGKVPVFTYSSNIVKGGQIRELREYWLFYGYDDVDRGLVQFSHQGDWERVTLEIYNNKIVAVRLDQHGDTKEYTLDTVEIIESNGVQTLKVYSARGAHATYEKVGKFDRAGVAHDFTGDGYQWEITRKVENLVDQPWKLYAGAWGEVGMTKYSTGPLGPWYKRMNI